MNLKRILVILAVVLTFGCFAVSVSASTVKAPGAPVIESSNVASSGKIRLEWDAVDGAAKYKVYRATSVDGKYSLMKTLTATSYVNSSAVAGKKYYYYVVALDAEGNVSKKSNKVSRVCDLAQPTITSITNVAKTGKIEVKWSAVEGAAKYKVYRSTSKNGTYTVLKTTTDLSYINNNATPGTVYYYKVKAIHNVAAGHSAFSAIKSRTCDLAQPVVKVSNDEDTGKIKLSWKEITGAKSYKVYRSTTKSGTYSLMKTVTGTSYTNLTSKSGKTYYYKVRAISANTNAHSVYSTPVSRICKLPKPTNVQVALNDNGRPKLTWDAVEGAQKYEIYRSLEETSKYKLIKTTTGTSFTNTSVNLDTKYFYKVKAIAANEDANSAAADPVSVKTKEYEKRYVSRHQIYAYVEPDSDTTEVCMPYMAEFDLGKAVHEYSSGNWYKIRYEGKIYYMWVAAGDQKFTDKKSSFEYTAENPYAQEIIDTAMMIYNEWETEYKSGQSTGVPNSNGKYGFDCSGFTTYCVNSVMQKYNPSFRLIGDTDTLYTQGVIYNEGLKGEFKAQTIPLDEIQPGDFIFLAMSGDDMNHVGIYLGNGELAHIASFWNKVTIMPLEGYFEERVCKVRRFIPEEVTPANKPMYAVGNWVNVYKESRSSSTVVHTCAKNEKVTILFVNANSSYAYVKTSSGYKGYVSIKNLSDTKV